MSRHIVIVALALALALAATAAAEPGKADPKGKAKGHEKRAPAASVPVEAAPAPPATPPSPAPSPTTSPAASHAQPPRTDAPTVPTAVPERRADALDDDGGGVVLQSRGSASMPAPVRTTTDSAPGGWPWAWALPVLGLVALGAALATTRPARLELGAPRRRASYITGTPTLEGLLTAGRTAVEASRFEEAIAWFTQALKLDPRLAVAHFCRGVCLATLGRHEEAYASLRKAHRIDPAEGAYRLELARAAARTARHKEAMEALAPVLQAMPTLAADAAEDEAFASMRDHPRWLAMLGKL